MTEGHNPYETPSARDDSSVRKQSDDAPYPYGFRFKVGGGPIFSPVLPPEVQDLVGIFHSNEFGCSGPEERFAIDIRAESIHEKRTRYYLTGQYETKKGKKIFKKYDLEIDVDENGRRIEQKSFETRFKFFRCLEEHRWSAPLTVPDSDQFKERILTYLRENKYSFDPSSQVTVDPIGLEWIYKRSDTTTPEREKHIFGTISPPVKVWINLYSRIEFIVSNKISDQIKFLS